MKLGSLFSGIGGFELGLERAIPGLETVWQVEQNKFCQKVLKKHWKNSKIYDDVKTVGKHNLEPVDILCAGFPCQGFSVSGKGKGLDDERSGLYWELWRVISELRPRIVVMENVPAITFRGLSDVLGSLASIGYDAEWCIISAAQFGAPHKRERWFCVAYPNESRCRSRGHLEREHQNHLEQERKTSKGEQSGDEWECRISSVCEVAPNPHGTSVQRNGGSIRIQSERAKPNIQIQNYWEQFPSRSKRAS